MERGIDDHLDVRREREVLGQLAPAEDLQGDWSRWAPSDGSPQPRPTPTRPRVATWIPRPAETIARSNRAPPGGALCPYVVEDFGASGRGLCHGHRPFISITIVQPRIAPADAAPQNRKTSPAPAAAVPNASMPRAVEPARLLLRNVEAFAERFPPRSVREPALDVDAPVLLSTENSIPAEFSRYGSSS